LTATPEQVDFDAFISPTSSVVAEGTMKADSLRFGSIEATNVDSKLRLQARQVFFNDTRAETYGLAS